MDQAIEIKEFILDNIPKYPNEIVATTAKEFGITRTTVHRHLKTLIKQNKVVKFGTTKQAIYYLSNQTDRKYKFKIQTGLTEDSVWKMYIQPLLKGLSTSLLEIFHYGFTEMFNNVLEHANASSIEVSIKRKDKNIQLAINDNGIGVFERLNSKFHFGEYRECLLHLTKGKITTDPASHTGEGLFFTARMFDHFYLMANGLCFYRNNLELDWALESIMERKGTHLIMEIAEESPRKLVDVFNQYSDLEEFSFNKTDLLVDLSLLEEERLISRSQAKRLLSKLEPFKIVILDFAKVITVGQGFADEVFRVYVSKHPDVQIKYINANQDVEFMIKRATGTYRLKQDD